MILLCGSRGNRFARRDSFAQRFVASFREEFIETIAASGS